MVFLPGNLSGGYPIKIYRDLRDFPDFHSSYVISKDSHRLLVTGYKLEIENENH